MYTLTTFFGTKSKQDIAIHYIIEQTPTIITTVAKRANFENKEINGSY